MDNIAFPSSDPKRMFLRAVLAFQFGHFDPSTASGATGGKEQHFTTFYLTAGLFPNIPRAPTSFTSMERSRIAFFSLLNDIAQDTGKFKVIEVGDTLLDAVERRDAIQGSPDATAHIYLVWLARARSLGMISPSEDFFNLGLAHFLDAEVALHPKQDDHSGWTTWHSRPLADFYAIELDEPDALRILSQLMGRNGRGISRFLVKKYPYLFHPPSDTTSCANCHVLDLDALTIEIRERKYGLRGEDCMVGRRIDGRDLGRKSDGAGNQKVYMIHSGPLERQTDSDHQSVHHYFARSGNDV